MIVDDDNAMTSLLKRMLEMEPEGFEIHVAPTAENALETCEQIHPELFMIDYHLKDMNGLELTQRLRGSAVFGSAPIVMASGMDIQQDALAAGVDHFLQKPFEPGDLAGLFVDLLRR